MLRLRWADRTRPTPLGRPSPAVCLSCSMGLHPSAPKPDTTTTTEGTS